MKKNKSTFLLVLIMLSTFWLQPLNAVLPSRGNGFWRLPLHMSLALGVTGLYVWGKHYEKNNPKVSEFTALALAWGTIASIAYAVYSSPEKDGGLGVKERAVLGTMGCCSFLAALGIFDSLEAVEKKIKVTQEQIAILCRLRDYDLVRMLLRKNPSCATTSVDGMSLACYVACRGIGGSLLGEDLVMLDWLLWFDKKNMCSVGSLKRNIAHYVAYVPNICSTEIGVDIVKRLDAVALNQKDSYDKTPLQYLIEGAEDGNKFAEKTKLMKIMLDNGADMKQVKRYFNSNASEPLKNWYKGYKEDLKDKHCGALASVVRMYADNSGSICKECSGRKTCAHLSNDLVVNVTEFFTGRLSGEQKQQCVKSQKESMSKNVDQKRCLYPSGHKNSPYSFTQKLSVFKEKVMNLLLRK